MKTMAIEKGSDSVTLKHASGGEVRILKYGATIISWTSPKGSTNLFLSKFIPSKSSLIGSAAKLDGSKAVRGGIPLVLLPLSLTNRRSFLYYNDLPEDKHQVFGKSSNHPTANLPQHGFARTSTWRIEHELENSITFVLTQEDLDAISRKLWGYEFKLTYTVELGESELKTELEIHNPGTIGFECNALLHTYLWVQVICLLSHPTEMQNVSEIGIEGLKGLTYKDKIEGGKANTYLYRC